VPPNEVTTIPPANDGSLDGVHVKLTVVAQIQAATALVQRPKTDDLYVAELSGKVLRLIPGSSGTLRPAAAPVLDLTAEVGTKGEQGLLGLAFSADGATLYVSYAATDGTSMVDGYTMKGDAADVATRHNLFTDPEGKGRVIHKGGALHLGPDGMLWLGLGDGGPENDPQDNAQNPKLRLGKMLRIDPATGKVTIWASGLRNPWRFSFDPAGNIWIADVGQNELEEIDKLPAATPPGANFGWSGFEGTNAFRQERVPARSVAPLVEMRHSDGWCAVIGGVVVTDPRLPKLNGAYVYGDLCRPELEALRADGNRVTAQRGLGVKTRSLIDIDADAAGRVYLLTQGGTVFRLDPK
jgi:glucose/arabinose dehydrogenase